MSASTSPNRARRAKSSSPAAIARAARDAEAVRLRLDGLTLKGIGDRLGVTASAVHKMIDREMIRTATTAGVEELRALELERLDVITRRIWEQIEDPDDDVALAAIDRYLQVSARRSQLDGLDLGRTRNRRVATVQPSPRDPPPVSTTPMVDVVAEYLSLVEEITADPVEAERRRRDACRCPCHAKDTPCIGTRGPGSPRT